MTLVLECQSESSLPIEVEGIDPIELDGLSTKEIATRKVWLGRQQVELGELFRVTGKLRECRTIVWEGNLSSVHWIGAGMSAGTMVIAADVGRHVGSRMSGGTIIAKSSVSDFLGAEMTGGAIRIHGDAGDLVGGNYNGSTFGMNRGTIIIDGAAGKGAGQSMRRGFIAIGGNADRLCGWNMLAGTILVSGNCGAHVGANMKRGTIILAGQTEYRQPPNFSSGGRYESSLMGVLATWLRKSDFAPAANLTKTSFQMYHGDLLYGGRGELFVVQKD